MKKSKKSNIVIVLVVLLLALAVGYAAFSTNLTITGTATTKSGNWNVKFTKAEITQSTLAGTFEQNTANVTNDQTVNVAAYLQAPGDGAKVTATIKNEGRINAKLTSLNVQQPTGADITVTAPTLTADNENLAAGQSRDFVFSVKWNENSTDTASDKTANFSITFTYEQDGVEFTGEQSFNVVTTNN